ncbi:pilus assembly protein TadG-related protein [Sphingomonas sp.]|uniref:pilus assembly protein TadG-related protein n=1 Tax=Sphingomonas sp. TaxID=28214 RepID=UPI0035BC9551
MIFGFALLPITFATGMTIDYARAARTQTRLNAVTDAAALAGVTPQMLSKTRLESAQAVANMWYAQAGVTQCSGATVNRVIFNPCAASGFGLSDNGTTFTGYDGTIRVTVTDNNAVGLSRVVNISYDARSENIFGNLLAQSSIAIGGTSTTNAKTAPNIDFFVMLDTSGSMAFPSTSAGITLLRSKTGGCAFACHSTNDATARDASNNLRDYYGVATSFGIPLRVDEAKTAVSNMMTLARTTANNNNATYQAALYSFAAADARANNVFRKLQDLTPTLSLVGTAANSASTSLYYSNGKPTKDYTNDDTDTATSDAFTRINAIMPNPGNGTKAAGDPPQKILFVITDGMRDESRPGSKPEVAIDTALCQTVKSRGIRIAILYTEYLTDAVTGDDWSIQASRGNILNRIPLIEPALTSCASPGLMYKVTTDGDISAALNKLFLASVSNAHIIQ